MIKFQRAFRLGSIGLGAGFQFLTTLYIARVSGLEYYGEYILQLVAMQFLVSFSAGGGTLFWVRERAKLVWNSREHNLMITVSLLLAIVFAIIGAFLFAWESQRAFGGAAFLQYIVLFLGVHIAHLLYVEVRYSTPILESISVFAWFVGRHAFLFILVFMHSRSNWSSPLLFMNMLSYIILLPFIYYLPRRLNWDWREMSAVLKGWSAVNMTTISSQLFTTLDVYAVRFIVGEAAVGPYSYVSRLLRPQLLVLKSFTQYYNKQVAERVAEGEFLKAHRLVRRIGRYSGIAAAGFGAIVVCYLLMFDPEIQGLVNNGSTQASIVSFVLLLFLANTLNCAFGPNSMLMIFAGLSKAATAINVLGFGVFLAMLQLVSEIFDAPYLAVSGGLIIVWIVVNACRERSLQRHAKMF